MICVFRQLRSCLVPSSERATYAVELVHVCGETVLDGGGEPIRFESEHDAVTFAERFLCEPHRVVPVEQQLSAAA
ncbi:MAG TPA: hypothetical protein VNF50_09895 [Acidimicrobiales bacterium]|nr:hypothetical protein [Acidimicrobiales bacterium]